MRKWEKRVIGGVGSYSILQFPKNQRSPYERVLKIIGASTILEALVFTPKVVIPDANTTPL
jgi:hypothetical protein